MAWPYQVDTESLKTEILGYLEKHPEAQDTLDGVLQWWLVRNRVMAGLNGLQAALAQLESEGEVARVTGNDGQQWYRAARRSKVEPEGNCTRETGHE
ncbi:hypothetical protein [Microbulbifer yueqingensis]|uniref:Uncharacterized protein n=1 Tax=Microbulbifer yueqingensis TaxID=658219 RepID=A0A1G8UF48_9GAMM|nr:hypothetical protein [Microbulbifer yueqingensis]SDJ51640.1 hypothetical protein SAMN05216212_0073 [Microbulbifer yueqingensis]